jgi:hypothetical protein
MSRRSRMAKPGGSAGPIKMGASNAVMNGTPYDYGSASIACSATGAPEFTTPASGSGVLTGVLMMFSGMSGYGNVRIFTAGTNFIVRGITDLMPVGGAYAVLDREFPVPIPYTAGDVLGWWTDRVDPSNGTLTPGVCLGAGGHQVHLNYGAVFAPTVGADLIGGGWVNTVVGANTTIIMTQARGIST